ncbi:DUF3343 domain-containing protein [Tissierella pigra]|uniref:DUF3343 domain-containing protein n=1 Tax=Tissierella pigra TaxID=2607614 RepID=A0A6N7XY74_9FIRM|nr:DUF3343 domain-containing protein [Tissierella pigra]MSU01524.1 DUF3343 domain-containing protein [Tissierella pigra]
MEEFYCVVTFHVTQHALIFENFMKKNNIDVKLMPVPRQVSSSCGTAAKIPCDIEEDVKTLCIKEDIPIDDFHHVINKKGTSWFSKYITK